MNTPYSNTSRTNTSKNFQAYYPVDINALMSAYRDKNTNTVKRLEHETSIGKSIILTLIRSVIGNGLKPQSVPVNEVLHWSNEERDRFASEAEAYFDLITGSPDFDHYGKQNFMSLQRVAFRNIISSGDVLLHRYYSSKENGYRPRIQVISGDWVGNPGYASDTQDCAGGIKLLDGREIGYYIKQTDVNRLESGASKLVNRMNNGFMEYNLIHLDDEDSSQLRGVPFLTAGREDLIDIATFKNAFLNKAMVQSLLSVFITKEQETDEPTVQEKVVQMAEAESDEYSEDGGSDETISLGAGNIISLASGEKPQTVESQVAGLDFDSFMKSNLRTIGASAYVPYCMFTGDYSSNYGASRATIAGAEKGFADLRSEYADKFCVPVWEQVIDYGIRAGHLKAPKGYFENPLIRKACLKTYWTGPGAIVIDPTKEVNAWASAVDNKFATREQAVATMYGRDWDSTIERLNSENEKIVPEDDKENKE